MQQIRPAFKCHGGKYYLARWIVSLFPPTARDLVYAEPFAGGTSVFFKKHRSAVEVVNDLDPAVYDLYAALRDAPAELTSALLSLDYIEATFLRAKRRQGRCHAGLDRAVNEYIL